MNSTSVIEIDKEAIKNNIRFIQELIGDEVLLSSVVKANAYGHGIEQFIPVAEEAGVKHFSVFSSDEAIRAKKAVGKGTKIMVLGWMDEDELEWAVENDIEFYVFEIDKLQQALLASRKVGKPARIHLEVETGMNRTGFKQKNLTRAIKVIHDNRSQFIISGVCTHYAGAESIANHVRVQRQIVRFKRILSWLEARNIKPELRHSACSAATIAYPKTRMDMVRIGILQYGFWPSSETFIHFTTRRNNRLDPLLRAISWKTRVMTVKEVSTGEFVSYGSAYQAHEPKRIAIIPVGYCHGYTRGLSNQGMVLIKGQRVKVIGFVNMNMMIADVTNLPIVKKGDEVVLIGRQEQNEITVASFSEFSNLLNYELLTRLPQNIDRVVV